VTAWSRYDNRWQGVATATLLASVQPLPQAKFVILKSFDAYATCVPLEQFAGHDALLATGWEGKPLTREHGGPVRLVLPALYFWKSPKWLRHVWFTDKDVPGTWEARGYHRLGDPWRQQRYG
jgi:DMSO/TMAO reductase YedYZ molybdopterin-dependent catalytic subunit